MKLIELVNVNKTYIRGENRVEALRNVNVSIDRGEFVAIVGKSGSGKSTMMNILGCLDSQTDGKYYLDKTDVAFLSDKEVSRIRNRTIGFIFQRFNLVSNLSAIENVELPLLYRGIGRDSCRRLAQEALDKVSLADRAEHFPYDLSGGQQQRVAIARAIAASPQILLADEPTGNLDSKSGDIITKLLFDFNKAGKTVIIITHDMSMAALAPRIIKIHDGVAIE